jgi:glycosyltransferase involved in cell wall biosynthesis
MHEEGQSNLDQRACGVASGVTARPVIDAKHGRSICILSLSRVADDPRVRRHGDAFHRAGWNIVAVGLPGARSAAPEWPIVTAAPSGDAPARQGPSIPGKSASVRPPKFRQVAKRQLVQLLAKTRGGRRLHGAAARLIRLRYSVLQLGVWIWPRLSHHIYWTYSAEVRGLYASGCGIDAAVWLANDWATLPIAARLARERGGIYGYDSHEFAVEEYGHQRKWRLLRRPMVFALERAFIRDAAVISAVSPGIAQCLSELHGLSRPALVLRNTPAFEDVRFHATGERIRVLYHGIVAPNRGLEETIESVADWRAEFDLTIRGPAEQSYATILRKRIDSGEASERIRLIPPVPMTELVREATLFDIGIFALPGNSQHNKFALPNKFFEYIMAGMALCVAGLPEMAALINQYGIGITIPQINAAAIAAAVNQFDRELVDRCKRSSRLAARELCWERESEQLVAAYRMAVT